MSKGTIFGSGDSTMWTDPASNEFNGVLHFTRLVKYVNSTYGKVQGINKGTGGGTSLICNSMPWLLGGCVPDLALIGFGMNDCVASNNISTTQFSNNIKKIINGLKQANPKVHIILCTPNTTTASGRATTIGDYRAVLEALAISESVDIARFETAWTAAQISTYTSDTVHPNAAGMLKLFNIVKEIVEERIASTPDYWLNQ